jgi:hypothetical protein
MEVEYPEQSSSFKDDELVPIVFSADIARALGHEVELLIQLHHRTVKITKVLISGKKNSVSYICYDMAHGVQQNRTNLSR